MITHDPKHGRFATANGAILTYRLENNRMIIDHTEVPAALRGQGIAAKLAEAALDHARRQNWRVVPLCSYVHTYMQRHPQYLDLLAE